MDPAIKNEDGKLLVFDVQRFCIHDGPGIRTVVFLKGCPLRCAWCQNPESQLAIPETTFHPERCTGCMTCLKACPNGALTSGALRIDRSKCRACGSCAEACPNEALRLIGRHVSPEELLQSLFRDKIYYGDNGGVTLSGGEPLIQAGPVSSLLRLCRQAGINTVVETCGAVPRSAIQKAIPYTDLFYFDIKGGSPRPHRTNTGVALESILDNARFLAGSGANVEFRMAVIPGKNDDRTEISAVAHAISAFGARRIRLLGYHAGGEAKIDRLGGGRKRLGIEGGAAEESLKRAEEVFSEFGLSTVREGEIREVLSDTPDRCEERSDTATTDVSTKRLLRTARNDTGKRERPKKALFPGRVWKLRAEVQSEKPAVCIERAVLVTQYFKNKSNRKRPLIVRKAEALGHVFKYRSARIYDGELLVGCFSSKRVGGSLLPETYHVALAEDLAGLSTRPVNPMQITNSEKLTLATKVFPFWSTRFLTAKAYPFPKNLELVYEMLKGDKYLLNETGGISHLVPDYEKLLRLGTSGIAEEARRLAGETQNPGRRDFYKAVEIACEALEGLARPYAAEARRLAKSENDPGRRAELESTAGVCERVPKYPAATLHEAFQSILFAQIAINSESLDNSVCPGRLDQILYPYFKADMDSGRIDEQRARDLVGCFTVKMSEIVPVFSKRITAFHGGIFNGQTVVVGGVDREGRDATNGLSWLFLDAMDALRMRQPNYHARIHACSPKDYTRRIAGMLRDGSGAPSLMFDETVVPMLEKRGMTLEDARDYSPVGCVEPVSCGATFGSTDAALVNLALCLERALGMKKGGVRTRSVETCGGIGEIVDLFRQQVKHLTEGLVQDLAALEKANADFHPTPLTSMLLRGCMESGIDSTGGGAIYNASGVQGVGVADVADSLAAIEDVVFKRRICDMNTLITALKSDFKGFETIRGHLLKAPKFGNDNPVADRFAGVAMKIFSDALGRYVNTRGGPYLAGFYSVTAHQAFGEKTGALPSGRLSGRPLANGLSPSNGMDRFGPTALLNSVTGLDLKNHARNGINVNLKFNRTTLDGEQGLTGLESLIKGYSASGGMQFQINVMDPAVLREAMANPDSHPWLLVRVSGYSAYFNDLSPAMKQDILDRTEQACGG
jgi:formate C-acetyltransferase